VELRLGLSLARTVSSINNPAVNLPSLPLTTSMIRNPPDLRTLLISPTSLFTLNA
jgi:hypothetical protein